MKEPEVSSQKSEFTKITGNPVIPAKAGIQDWFTFPWIPDQPVPARSASHSDAGGSLREALLAGQVGNDNHSRCDKNILRSTVSIGVFRSAFIAAIILGLCGCGGKNTKKSAAEVIPVRCVRVETRDLKRTLDYASSIKAQDDAMVYPKVTGKIIEKLKEDGAAVNKGDTIAFIDRDEIGFKFEKSPVDSPLTGIIGSVYVDKGDSVTPQTAIAFVVNLDNVRVSLDVPEKYLPIMTLGQSADISVDAFPDLTFTGKVSKISPIVDLQTRTAPIEIFIPNPGHKLTPGMFARVKLVLEEKKQVKLIPKEAVIGNEPEAIVFVVEGNIAHQRKVKPGVRDGGEIEIVEGLNAGDLVVIMGQQRLCDGAEVIAEEENLTERIPK